MDIIDTILKYGILVLGTIGYFMQVHNRFIFKKENTEKSLLKAIDSSIWCLIFVVYVAITFLMR